MANNCLVTKLKASVNNPNLPSLEVMQQFTLDAISFSGNASMTDDQKWELNHLFYALGAIDNPTLWAKMKYVFIPMISNDNSSKAMNDYKNHTSITDISSPTFQNHGITFAMEYLKTAISGSLTGLTNVVVSMGSTFGNDYGRQFVLGSGNTEAYCVGVSTDYDGVYCSSFPYMYVSKTKDYDIASLSNGTNFANFKLMSSVDSSTLLKEATVQQIEGRTTRTFTSETAKFSARDTYYGFMLLADTLTDAERDNIMNACVRMKNAFSISQE